MHELEVPLHELEVLLSTSGVTALALSFHGMRYIAMALQLLRRWDVQGLPAPPALLLLFSLGAVPVLAVLLMAEETATGLAPF